MIQATELCFLGFGPYPELDQGINPGAVRYSSGMKVEVGRRLPVVQAILTGLKSSWRRLTCLLAIVGLAAYLTLGLYSCAQQPIDPTGARPSRTVAKGVAEVSPPATIQELRPFIDRYQPQVAILTPQPDAVLQDPTVSVKLQVQDLPLFQDPELKMGPHLHLILDNQPYRAIYDVSEPIVLENLAPGTHALRVFAARPWHESFKNEGAYAQVTFHIFAKTPENNPAPSQPILTYSRPQGEYGAEPILLDFYLTNAPLHLAAQADPEDAVVDWRIRCTLNGSSFILDRWQPIYLKGWKPGNNWVQLEYLDEQGNLLQNVFNSTIRLIRYDPGGQDTLSRLVRGDLSAEQARSIVDPTYAPPTSPTPLPSPTPSSPPSPSPVLEESSPSPSPAAVPPVLEELPQEELPEMSPEIVPLPQPEPSSPSPELRKPSGFLNRFRRADQPSAAPDPVTPLPEIPPLDQLGEPTGEAPKAPTALEEPASAPPEVPETPVSTPSQVHPSATVDQAGGSLNRFRDGRSLLPAGRRPAYGHRRFNQPDQPLEEPLPIPQTIEAPEPAGAVPTTVAPAPQPSSEEADPGAEAVETRQPEPKELPAEALPPVEVNRLPQPSSQRLNWRRYLSPQPSPTAAPIVQPSFQPALPDRYPSTPGQDAETELSPTTTEIEPPSAP